MSTKVLLACHRRFMRARGTLITGQDTKGVKEDELRKANERVNVL